MKKFAKGCLITALSMLSIGILILIICIIIGGSSLFSYLRNEVSHRGHISGMFDNTVVTFHNGKSHVDFSDHHPTYSGQHENAQVAKASDIANLNIDFGGGMCVISESSDEYFHIHTENANEFQYYTDGNTLFLKGFDDITSGVHSSDFNKVYLEIPKNFSFKNINIELGAGYLESHALIATDSLSLEVGAGELITDSLAADTLTLEVGAGNAELYNASVNDSEITVGFGNITYHGIITKDLTAECDMGNLELLLQDSYEAHNYNIDCAMGNMTLNGKAFGAFAYSDQIQHSTDSTYSLECGMGNMNILFNGGF